MIWTNNRRVFSLASRVYGRIYKIRRDLYHYQLRKKSISREVFLQDIKHALENKIGYAAGKIGLSQKHWLYYPILLRKNTNRQIIEHFEEALIFHGLKQSGIFPASPEYYLHYNDFYVKHLKNIDCLGLFFDHIEMEKQIIKFYRLDKKIIHYIDQEPDRSIPSNDDNCYLKYFREKNILLICPFAELLKERATKEIFEGVWSKTGKKWFYPKKVEALEFPYGFSVETHEKYNSAIDLFHFITRKMKKIEFDIALIAAAGLAIPLASYVKNLGKVGIDLGGHLQILFGVLGKRWRSEAFRDWRRLYFNEYWIDMPSKYKPKEEDVCDGGAYW